MYDRGIRKGLLFQSQNTLLNIVERGVGLQAQCLRQYFEVTWWQGNMALSRCAITKSRYDNCWINTSALRLAEHAETDGDFCNGNHDTNDNQDNDDPSDVAHLCVGNGVGQYLGKIEEDAASLVENFDAWVDLKVLADGGVKWM